MSSRANNEDQQMRQEDIGVYARLEQHRMSQWRIILNALLDKKLELKEEETRAGLVSGGVAVREAYEVIRKFISTLEAPWQRKLEVLAEQDRIEEERKEAERLEQEEMEEERRRAAEEEEARKKAEEAGEEPPAGGESRHSQEIGKTQSRSVTGSRATMASCKLGSGPSQETIKTVASKESITTQTRLKRGTLTIEEVPDLEAEMFREEIERDAKERELIRRAAESLTKEELAEAAATAFTNLYRGLLKIRSVPAPDRLPSGETGAIHRVVAAGWTAAHADPWLKRDLSRAYRQAYTNPRMHAHLMEAVMRRVKVQPRRRPLTSGGVPESQEYYTRDRLGKAARLVIRRRGDFSLTVTEKEGVKETTYEGSYDVGRRPDEGDISELRKTFDLSASRFRARDGTRTSMGCSNFSLRAQLEGPMATGAAAFDATREPFRSLSSPLLCLPATMRRSGAQPPTNIAPRWALHPCTDTEGCATSKVPMPAEDKQPRLLRIPTNIAPELRLRRTFLRDLQDVRRYGVAGSEDYYRTHPMIDGSAVQIF